jgi:hypothetical protein
MAAPFLPPALLPARSPTNPPFLPHWDNHLLTAGGHAGIFLLMGKDCEWVRVCQSKTLIDPTGQHADSWGVGCDCLFSEGPAVLKRSHHRFPGWLGNISRPGHKIFNRPRSLRFQPFRETCHARANEGFTRRATISGHFSKNQGRFSIRLVSNFHFLSFI